MKRTTGFGLFIFLLSCGAAAAEVQAQIEAPLFSRHSLLNGLEFLTLKGEGQPNRFAMMIRNGAAFDPHEKWGLTELTCRLLLEQTEHRSGTQLREDLAAMGSTLSLKVAWDAFFFYGMAPENRLEDTLKLLAEVVLKPRFTEEKLEQVRSQLLAEVEQAEQNLSKKSLTLLRSRLFGQNPYGHSVRGTVSTLPQITLTDVKIQYRRLFMPNQAQVATTSSGDNAQLLRSMGRHWGSWTRQEAIPFTFRRADSAPNAHVLLLDMPGESGLFRIASLGTKRGSQDYYILKVLEQYLTLVLPEWAEQVAAAGQIQAEVKLESGMMPGLLQLSIQAAPDQLVPYATKFRQVIEDLKIGHVDPQRFQEAKDLAVLELANLLRNPKQELLQILESNLYGLGISYLSNYGLRIDRVGLPRFSSGMQRLFPTQSYVLVVVGPVSKLASELEKFGQVEILN